jgi:hypothetical protein
MTLSKIFFGGILVAYHHKGCAMTKEKEKMVLEKIDTVGSYLLVLGIVLALVFAR